jgi:hypothetical protein
MTGDTWQVQVQLSVSDGVLFAQAVLADGPVPAIGTSRVPVVDEPTVADRALAARRALTDLAGSLRRFEVPAARGRLAPHEGERPPDLVPEETAIA